jgi:hypothetical protein
MKSDAWVNSSALLGRMNFSLALMAGRIKGAQADGDRLLNPTSANATDAAATDPEQALAWLETSLLAGEVSKQTHDAIVKEIEDPTGSPQATARKKDNLPASSTGTIAGLILGSPEFQRR